jgi:hypothetical protein
MKTQVDITQRKNKSKQLTKKKRLKLGPFVLHRTVLKSNLIHILVRKELNLIAMHHLCFTHLLANIFSHLDVCTWDTAVNDSLVTPWNEVNCVF